MPKLSISAITFYEFGQKVRLGKWDEMEPLASQLVSIALEVGFDLISLSARIATAASLLDWSHPDPFDGMIAAVAVEEGAGLISSGHAIDDLENVNRLWGLNQEVQGAVVLICLR